MIKQVIIASLAIAAFGATSAQAQSRDTRSMSISFAGIDARSESGARLMLRRIEDAAETVCGPAPSNFLERSKHYTPCVREATEQAVAKLSNPLVTALHTKGQGPSDRPVLASASK